MIRPVAALLGIALLLPATGCRRESAPVVRVAYTSGPAEPEVYIKSWRAFGANVTPKLFETIWQPGLYRRILETP
jgi:hypothetical protein